MSCGCNSHKTNQEIEEEEFPVLPYTPEPKITFLHYMLERYDLDIIEAVCVIRKQNGTGIIWMDTDNIKNWDYAINVIKKYHPQAFEHKELQLEYSERDFVKPIIH